LCAITPGFRGKLFRHPENGFALFGVPHTAYFYGANVTEPGTNQFIAKAFKLKVFNFAVGNHRIFQRGVGLGKVATQL